MRLCTKTASPSATATKGLTGSPHTRVDRSVGDRIAEPKLEANSTQMCRRHGNRSSGQSVHGQKDGELEDISNLHATEAGTRYTSVKGHHCYFTSSVPQAVKTKDNLGFICLKKISYSFCSQLILGFLHDLNWSKQYIEINK